MKKSFLKKLSPIFVVFLAGTIAPINALVSGKNTFKGDQVASLNATKPNGNLKLEDVEWVVDEGDNHIWYKLSDDHATITLGGTGRMPSFNPRKPAPWWDYMSDIYYAEIGEDIDFIGGYSFLNHSNLQVVTFMSNSVQEMGNGLFNGCDSLEMIRVPSYALTAYKNSSGLASYVNLICPIGGYVAIENEEALMGGEENDGKTVTFKIHCETGYVLSFLSATTLAEKYDKGPGYDEYDKHSQYRDMGMFYNLVNGDSVSITACKYPIRVNYLFEKIGAGTFDTNHTLSVNQYGVTSNTWKSDINTIVSSMKDDGRYNGIDLDLSPWVTGENTSFFGEMNADEALDFVKEKVASGELNVLATSISFPKVNYSTMSTYLNTAGYMYGFGTDNCTFDALIQQTPTGEVKRDKDGNPIFQPLYDDFGTNNFPDFEEVWEARLAYTEAAAKLTHELGMNNLVVDIGLIRVEEDIALERMKEVCAACAKYNVTVLIKTVDSSLYLNNLIKTLYYEGYINVGFYYDSAFAQKGLGLIENPKDHYDIMRRWIRYVRVGDCKEDNLVDQWNEECPWGEGIVPKYRISNNADKFANILDKLRLDGFTGPIVFSYDSGDSTLTSTRLNEIKLSTDRILKIFDEHNPTKIDGVTPTCTEGGYKDAYYCLYCDSYYEDEACLKLIGNEEAYEAWKLAGGKLSPLGHSLIKVNGKAATPTEDGYQNAYKCEHCGLYYEDINGNKLIGDETAYNSWKLGAGKTTYSEALLEDEVKNCKVNRSLMFSYSMNRGKVEFAKDANGNTLMSLDFGVSISAQSYAVFADKGAEVGIAYKLKGSATFIHASLDGYFTDESMGAKAINETLSDACLNEHLWSARLCIDNIDEANFLTEITACFYALDADGTYYYGEEITTSVCQTAKDYIDTYPNNNEVRKCLPALTYLAGMLAA